MLSVISPLEFSLDPPQAANAIAAVESRANVFDVVLIFLMEANYPTRIGFARHEGKFLNNFIYLFIGRKNSHFQTRNTQFSGNEIRESDFRYPGALHTLEELRDQ